MASSHRLLLVFNHLCMLLPVWVIRASPSRSMFVMRWHTQRAKTLATPKRFRRSEFLACLAESGRLTWTDSRHTGNRFQQMGPASRAPFG